MISSYIQKNDSCTTTGLPRDPREIAEQALEDIDAGRTTLHLVVTNVDDIDAKTAGVVLRLLGDHYRTTGKSLVGCTLMLLAAKLGDCRARSCLAYEDLLGEPDERTRDDALHELETMAKQGEEIALGALAALCQRGRHVQRNLNRAADLYKEMLQSRDLAMGDIGTGLCLGSERIANMNALSGLARLYAYGVGGISKDLREASRLQRLGLDSFGSEGKKLISGAEVVNSLLQ
jgi:hypothetical protein